MSEYSDMHVAPVREVEPPRVRHLLIYYFLQGIGLSLLFTVSTSLFLSSFVAADLPMAFIISAGVLLASGIIYNWLDRKLSMYKRAFFLISVALAIFLLYACTQMFTAMWVPLVMFIFCRILFSISDVEFWGLSNLLFDTRDSKSLFGCINMREIPAKMIGYFSVGLLLPIVELPTLLVIAGVAFLINFFVLRQLLDPRYAREVKSQPVKQPEGRWPAIKFPGAPLLMLLCALAAVGVIAFSFINFSFLSLVEDKFHKASELAAYLGLVLGVASALTAVGKAFMTNEMLSRIGAKVSMLALPVFILVICGLAARSSGGEERMFTFFTLLLVGGKIFKDVLYEPIFVSLSQPLPTDIRQRSYNIARLYAEPLALALSGVLINAILGHLPHPDFYKANYVLLSLAIIWAVLVVITFQKYIGTFKWAIAKRALVTRAFDSFNSFSQAIMREKLESQQPDEVIYAYEICSASNVSFFQAELGKLLRHESGEVRKYALNKMAVDTPFSDTEILLHLASSDPAVEVRQLAIIHSGARYRDFFGEQYYTFLESPDLRIKQAAIKGLMESGNPEIIMIAGHKLNDLILSDNGEQNIIAATIIGDMKLNSHYRHLLSFFEHADLKVRKAAIKAAGKLTHPKLMPMLFTLLADKEQNEEAIIALSNYQKYVVSYLLENKWLLERHPTDILNLCSYIDEKIAAMIICQYLLPPAETELLDGCLQALHHMHNGKAEVDRGILELKLVSTGLFIYTCLRYSALLPDNASILRQALAAEVRNGKRRILLLLALMYDKKSFDKVIDVYDVQSDNKGTFIKLLGSTIDDNHKKRFLPIFDLADNAALAAHLGQFYQLQLKDDITEVILQGRKKSMFLIWTQAAALYTYLLELSDEVLQVYKNHPEKMIFEMVQLALSRKPFALRLIEDESNASFTIDQQHDDTLLNIEKIVVLRTIPIFENFTQPMFSAICNIMQEQRFQANGTVYGENEPGNSMFIIYYGTVSMYNGGQEILRQGGKEIVVKIASENQRLASAKALTDTLLFRIDKEDIESLKIKQPEMAESMLQLFITT